MTRGKFRPDVVTCVDLDANPDLPSHDPAFRDYHILAEGDSWFTLCGIPTSNLLFAMRFNRSTLIANCGMPGDTIKHMAQIGRNKAFRDALADTAFSWKLILLSGGGNDLIDDADEILIDEPNRAGITINGPADYCDQGRLAQLVDEVEAGYRRLVATRDAPASRAQGTPIITHTYDYPTPRNSPARFVGIGLLGPWIYSALTRAQVPEADWQAVSDYLFDTLADAIVALSQGPNALPNFHVVDTRDTLTRASPGTTGDSGDWMNEIHPDFEGYTKIAELLEAKAAALLPS